MKKILPSYLVIFTLLLLSKYAFSQDIGSLGKQKPVTLSGGISARSIFYTAKGIENRRKPFSYVLTGSPILSLYGITIPFYFVFSEQERSFRQPFNQFGMSPHYKWITVHAGYRNITYSPYTMAGHTILGAGVDLTPGIFRFGFIYGRLNKATAIDTTTGSFDPYSYTRKGYATKIGIGKGGNFLDFSLLKAKDDSSSIGEAGRKANKVTPAENVVLGLRGQLTIKGFFMEADGGISFYTNDLSSSVKTLDSLPKLLTGTMGKFIKVNGSSEFYSAYNVGAGYRFKHFSLKLQYKRIDPDYKSMGAYFFNNDLENITIAPTFSLLKNKINFAGSVGIQRDNLQNQKEATSRRVIGSANLSLNITDNLGIDASYFNFSTNQKPGRVFVSDSFLITQTTKNISVAPRYMINKAEINHVFLLSWNYMNLVDLNDITSQNNNLNSTNIFFNYQVVLVPKNLTLYINLNSTHLHSGVGKTGNKGVTLGGNKTFMKNKLSLGLSNSFLSSSTGNSSAFLMNTGLQCTFRVTDHHSFSTNMNYIGNYPGTTSTENPRFKEFRGEVAYMFTF